MSERFSNQWRRVMLHPKYMGHWSLVAYGVFWVSILFVCVGWWLQLPTEVLVMIAIAGVVGIAAGVLGNLVISKNREAIQNELEQEERKEENHG